MVESCVIHPDYVELNNSDVAVCRLQSSFPIGEKIQPIPLDTNYVGGGENCVSILIVIMGGYHRVIIWSSSWLLWFIKN
jgi:hypothetical protein